MRISSPLRRRLAAATAPWVLVAVAGCGSDADPAAADLDDTPSSTVAGDPSSPPSPSQPAEGEEQDSEDTDDQPTDEQVPHTLKSLLPAMKAAVDEHRTAHLTMDIGEGGQTVSAVGDVSYAAKSPSIAITMNQSGSGGGTVEIRVVDELVYLSAAPMTPEGKFLRIDPKDSGDPLASTFGVLTGQADPLGTFDAFEAGMRNVRYLGEESVSGEAMHHYVVTVDAAAAMKKHHQLMTPGMPKRLEYDLWLDGEDLMRKVTFDVTQGISMDMTLSNWGEPVTITAPSAKDIVKLPTG